MNNFQNQEVKNPLSVMQANETEIFKVKRHPFGLIGINIAAAAILVVLAVVLFGILPHTISTIATSHIVAIGLIVYIIVALIVFAFLAVTHKVYWGNCWVLTSDSITQVSQTSLFDKQSSQLSLGNLEDISAEQNGMLAHMFNFGTLKVETAGERSKFQFPYCPNPTYYAQQVIRAREVFEQSIMQGERPAANANMIPQHSDDDNQPTQQ